MREPARHTFETLWGHDAVKAYVLRQLSEGRLPPVLLLEGPDGVGKRSFALAAAKVLLSAARRMPTTHLQAPARPKAKKKNPEPEPIEDDGDLFGAFAEPEPEPQPDLFASPAPDEPDLFAHLEPEPPQTPKIESKPTNTPPPVAQPPGPRVPTPFLGLSDEVCRRVEASYPVKFDSEGRPETIGHPDLTIIEPPGSSKSILSGQIDALHRMASLPPIQGECRLFILLGIDTITQFAANSMLKLLEEPPAHLRFILVTDNPGRVLATIRSRSTRLPFFPMRKSVLETHLIEKEGLARDLASVAAALSQGRPGIALKIAAGGVLAKRREAFDARLSLERLGVAGLPGACHRILASGGSYEESVLLLMSLLRDRLVSRHAPGRGEFLVNSDVTDLIASGAATDGTLDGEWNALLQALREARHPFLPNAQAALESALWSVAEGAA